MHNIFNHLLAGLCLGDLLFLLCNLLVVPIALGRDGYPFNLIHPIAECGCHISLSVCIFLTVSITVERFQVTVSDRLIAQGSISVGGSMDNANPYKLRTLQFCRPCVSPTATTSEQESLVCLAC